MNFRILNDDWAKIRQYPFADFKKPQNVGTVEGVLRCPHCDVYKSRLPWLEPRCITFRSVKKLGDAIWGSFASQTFACSNRFKEYWLQSGLTGILEFQALEVYKRSSRYLDQGEYWLPKIIMDFDARIDVVASNLIYATPPDLCPVCIRGKNGIFKDVGPYVFEHPEALHYDIFVDPFAFELFVSDRFVAFVEEHSLTNITYTELEDYLLSFGTRARALRDAEYMKSVE